MSHFPCTACGYWLHHDEDHCAGCGATSRDAGAPWRRRLRARAQAATVALTAAWTVSAQLAFDFTPLGLLIVLGLAAGVSMHLAGAAADVLAQRRLATVHPLSLAAAEADLARQLDDNDRHVGRLLSARATVEDVMPAADATPALALIDRRHEVREREQMLLRTRRWAIGLARWVNALSPALDGFHRVDYDEADRRLALTAQLRQGARALRARWRAEPAAATAEGAELLARLDDAIAGVDTLRAELALRKALLADPAASPLAIARPASPLVERELARFARLAAELAAGCHTSAGDVDDAQLLLGAEDDLRDAA